MKKLILTIAILGSSFAHADIAVVEKAFNTCAEAAVSTMDSNICSSQAYQDADAELNMVFKKIKNQNAQDSETSVEMNKRLVNAQRAWIAFRDADCELSGSSMLGGTGEGMIINGCLATTTIERVKNLSGYLNTNK